MNFAVRRWAAGPIAVLALIAGACGQTDKTPPPVPSQPAPSAPSRPATPASAPLNTPPPAAPVVPTPPVPPQAPVSAPSKSPLQMIPADPQHFPAKLYNFAQPASPAPADFTASPEIECFGNIETMGVIATLPADLQTADVDAIKCFLNVGGAWKPVQDLVQVGKTSHFAGSIFWLMPAGRYQVKVMLEHPPGTTLKNWYGQGETRSNPVVPAAAHPVFVATNGNDTGDGSAEHPFKTVAKAIEQAAPGSTIQLKGGVYYEGDFTPSKNGAPDQPITLQSTPGEVAVLDGSNPDLADPGVWKKEDHGLYSHGYEGKCYNAILEDKKTGKLTRLIPIFTPEELQTHTVGKHGNFPGGSPFAKEGISGAFACDGQTAWLMPPAPLENYIVHIARATKAFGLENRSHLQFHGLTIRYYGKEDYSCAALVYNSSDILFDHCQFVCNDTGIWVKGKSDRVTVQDCTFFDDLSQSPFGMVKIGGNPASFEAGAINVDGKYSGRGLIVRRNHIEGLFDGVHLCPWVVDDAATNETDFYQNTILDCVDDFIETDGYARNVRIFDNYMRRSLSGVSLAQALDGPTYVMYNVLADCGCVPSKEREGNGGYPFKTNGGDHADVGSGMVYFYHNTANSLDPDSRAIWIKRPTWRKFVFRNNSWIGKKQGFDCWKNPPSPMDFDYDDLFCLDKTAPLVVLNYKTNFATLDDVRAKLSWLPHGISADPLLTDEKAGVYTLNAGSPCIDAGTVVPGVDDGRMQGKAPDLGAFESK
ncbi:MAG TPA: DUF1565 domain-containing protein [Planctomycetota bacterium]|nr:DUF1565 domain-containing protein [Planctomycetota bacterium]